MGDNKKARLVKIELITRVVADSDASDEELVELASSGFIQKLQNGEALDNLVDIVDDTECPYEPDEPAERDFRVVDTELDEHWTTTNHVTGEVETEHIVVSGEGRYHGRKVEFRLTSHYSDDQFSGYHDNKLENAKDFNGDEQEDIQEHLNELIAKNYLDNQR